ncbi:S41 family peptidase [Salsuginibacillus kocurii]|uniref:S41 family peptidase n=1 Tax=Salsuginibacillus kocurii TaxID=427078 RepID=UPI00036C9020|nr:S41 family peptidase [Salsuginibacillus kocurii]
MGIRTRWVAAGAVSVLLLGAGGLYAFVGDDGGQSGTASNGEEESTSELTLEDLGLDEETAEEMDFSKVEEAFEVIQSQYVDEVDEEDLIQGAIEGMVEGLDDPFSDYMDAETADQFMESLDSQFEGIGAEVSMENGYVTIMSPFQDSPAEEAGLQPNDRILEIEGESTEDQSLNEAVLDIRGEKGTTVTLTIDRPAADDPFEVEVERDEIPVETVTSEIYELDGYRLGVLEMTSFSEETATEFEEQLEELEEEDIDGLAIDVRGNPGGYLNSVEDIGDLIVPGGEPVVQIEDRNGNREPYISNLEEEKPYPIVTLINEGSASASEILAAALKEAGDYDVIGETTFGKGTVQQVMPFDDGSELQLSMFRWLTSAGNDINEEGVEPTIEVTQPDFFYLPAISVDEELGYDDTDDQIEIAQEILAATGHDPGRSDGYFDEATEAALQSFQAEENVEATGVLDEDTALLLHQAVLEEIRDTDNDRQLEEALNTLLEQQ